MDTTNIVYVKALGNGEWFGSLAPVGAQLEWMRPDGQVGLFTLDLTYPPKNPTPS